jgi:hypothetical protein
MEFGLVLTFFVEKYRKRNKIIARANLSFRNFEQLILDLNTFLSL